MATEGAEETFALFAPTRGAAKARTGSPAGEAGLTVLAVEAGDGEAVGAAGFAALGLDPWQLETLGGLSIRRPTPVQVACIPRILEGMGVSAAARTGSGKTAAFALPVLKKLSEDPFGIFALVLTPTRYGGAHAAGRAYGGVGSWRCRLWSSSGCWAGRST